MRKHEADSAMALSLQSVSITEFQQEPILGEHPGDAPSSEGDSGERRSHDHRANCLAESRDRAAVPATLMSEEGQPIKKIETQPPA
jgi:hypothetical protein